ncbi:MAG: hypothetical protein R2816_01690 [Flavobacteriaceae bacterium]|nr:hypothetical protein [Flavobacteriaceae bacterium]
MKGFIKHVCYLFLLGSALSCSSSKEAVDLKPLIDFDTVQTPLVLNNDTILVNELRFYKIQSALDAMKLMYLNYGEWNEKIKGRYQENINEIIWSKIKLLDSDENFTVIASGTETLSDYFAILIALDSKNNDCLADEHPYKNELLELFTSKMKTLDKKKSVYKLFK